MHVRIALRGLLPAVHAMRHNKHPHTCVSVATRHAAPTVPLHACALQAGSAPCSPNTSAVGAPFRIMSYNILAEAYVSAGGRSLHDDLGMRGNLPHHDLQYIS